MDFLKKMSDGVGGGTKESTNSGENQNSGVGMFKDKLNGMAGGGKQGEENEDGLDKGALITHCLWV